MYCLLFTRSMYLHQTLKKWKVTLLNMLHRRLTRTDQSHCPDARPGEQEVVPASEKAGQPASLAFPRLVGSPLHLRHLLQDALPPVHQEQVCHIFLSSSCLIFSFARKWQDSALTWVSSAAGLASLASLWLISHYQPPSFLANSIMANLPEQVTRLVKLS